MTNLDKLKKALRLIQKYDHTLFLSDYFFKDDELHKKIESFYDYHNGENSVTKSHLVTEEMAEKIEWGLLNRLVNAVLIEQEEETQKQKRLKEFYGE
jgi:hypothetical protein